MQAIKVHCYCANASASAFIDTRRVGTQTIRIPAFLTGARHGILLDIGLCDGEAKPVLLPGDSYTQRIGDSFTSGALAEFKRGGADIIITVTDVTEGYSFYRIDSKKSVSVGCSTKHDVVYSLEAKSTLSQDPYFVINNSDGQSYVENKSPLRILYVNGKNVQGSASLKYGDKIEALGLSIIYLGDLLAVGNPGGLVQANLAAAKSKDSEGASPAGGLISSGLIGRASAREELEFHRVARIYSAIKAEQFRIEQPVQAVSREKLPAALTIGPTVTMGITTASSIAMNIGSGNNNISGFIMSGAMLLGMLLWPNLSKRYQTKLSIEREKERQSQYRSYLTQINQTIDENAKENLRRLNSTNPATSEISEWVDHAMLRRIWERSHYDADFLQVRIGVGEAPNPSSIDAPKPGYQNVDDKLITEAIAIKEQHHYLKDSPVLIDLKRSNSVGIVGMGALVRNMAMGFVMQLAALHDASEVKLAFVYDGMKNDDFSWIKKLPHTWSNEMDFRYIAQDKAEVQQLFRRLLEEIEGRIAMRGNNEGAPVPAYVLFVMDEELIEDVSVSRFISADYAVSGFASVYAFGGIETIPNGCKSIVQTLSDSTSVYDRTNENSGFRRFERETVNFATVQKLAAQMSLFNIESGGKSSAVPANVTFLDLFKVGSVEQIDIFKLWEDATPQKSLAVPIGIKAGGELFYLDIHEKAHGSHGLMAGTTGSGKSEAIQAIILSLAVHYHPDDVCFVLIDFKGGGMANLFDGMPHIVGTMTNLGNSIRRSMISLNAEIKNRQTMLKDAGVNHIDKYQKLFHEGSVSKPMPHMVLISDEFAELKAQRPEFMAELISIARIGRSLGVHLILATQKPTGVVDDQIWSNTRFRICLKVADKADSNGMLDSPLAATITLPGRAYVQVGFNEIFEHVQTAYTGADYLPTEEYIDLETKQVLAINSCAQQTDSAAIAVKAKPSAEGAPKLNQLEATVNYIAEISQKRGIAPRVIWTEPVPHLLDLSKTDEFFTPPADAAERRVPIGILDDPEKQTLRSIDLSLDNGHIAIYGIPGCGKTTFVQTALYSFAKRYSPNEVKFRIIDFGSRVLEIFKAAPHTECVMSAADADDICDLLQNALDELDIRKEKFALVRQESLANYIRASGETLPTILLVVDGYQKFAEEMPEAVSILTQIIKDGAKYGVVAMLTTSAVNAISYRLADYFSEKYALLLSDALDYATVVGATHGMFPENVKGRGLYKYDGRLLEYQTALCFAQTDDGERSRMIIENFTASFGPINTEPTPAAAPAPAPRQTPSTRSTGRTQGGFFGAFGKTSERSGSASGRNAKSGRRNKLPLSAYMPEDGTGVVIALNRASNAPYHLPYGRGMYLLEGEQSNPHLTQRIAAGALAAGKTVFYCGNAAIPEGLSGITTEQELDNLVQALSGGASKDAVVVIEDLMTFYRAITDVSLDALVTLLEGNAGLTLIAAVKLADAKILKDYPLGITLFKSWMNGMLISGKPIESVAVLPQELMEALSPDERNMTTGAKSALLFQGDGAFERVLLP